MSLEFKLKDVKTEPNSLNLEKISKVFSDNYKNIRNSDKVDRTLKRIIRDLDKFYDLKPNPIIQKQLIKVMHNYARMNPDFFLDKNNFDLHEKEGVIEIIDTINNIKNKANQKLIKTNKLIEKLDLEFREKTYKGIEIVKTNQYNDRIYKEIIENIGLDIQIEYVPKFIAHNIGHTIEINKIIAEKANEKNLIESEIKKKILIKNIEQCKKIFKYYELINKNPLIENEANYKYSLKSIQDDIKEFKKISDILSETKNLDRFNNVEKQAFEKYNSLYVEELKYIENETSKFKESNTQQSILKIIKMLNKLVSDKSKYMNEFTQDKYRTYGVQILTNVAMRLKSETNLNTKLKKYNFNYDLFNIVNSSIELKTKNDIINASDDKVESIIQEYKAIKKLLKIDLKYIKLGVKYNKQNSDFQLEMSKRDKNEIMDEILKFDPKNASNKTEVRFNKVDSKLNKINNILKIAPEFLITNKYKKIDSIIDNLEDSVQKYIINRYSNSKVKIKQENKINIKLINFTHKLYQNQLNYIERKIRDNEFNKNDMYILTDYLTKHKDHLFKHAEYKHNKNIMKKDKTLILNHDELIIDIYETIDKIKEYNIRFNFFNNKNINYLNNIEKSLKVLEHKLD